MKQIWLAFLMLFVMVSGQVAQASNNPFKKTKEYHFGPDVAWYQKAGMAAKSGQVRERGDVLYFHLSINNKQLQLRLSKNDPTGDLLNSRNLKSLTVKDVRVDGRRLPVFQWCLNNQEQPARNLKQYAQVPGETCVNADGDLIIQLDKKTLERLKQARQLQFVLEPFRREVTLDFDMQGYNDIMAQIYPPVQPKPKARVIPPVVKTPVAKPAAVVKPRPAKICHARAPASFHQIKAIAYPCKNKARKAKAHEAIAAQVKEAKQKKAKAEAEKQRKLEAIRKADEADKKRQIEWEKMQRAMWIGRCQKHWDKGVSPCFCKKYINEAPEGVKNTCKK